MPDARMAAFIAAILTSQHDDSHNAVVEIGFELNGSEVPQANNRMLTVLSQLSHVIA
jgi:hypothetical protein